jgi:hypothetical protein
MAAEYREFCRRQHRQLAAYLSIYTWKAGADFVVVNRRVLENWLSRQRFKSTREGWFLADIEPWFSFYERVHSGQGSLWSYFLSPREFKNFPDGRMSDEDRVRLLRESGRIGILASYVRAFAHRSGQPNALERTAVRELNEIAMGLSDLRHFRVKKQK